MKIPCLPLFIDEFISNGNHHLGGGVFSSTNMVKGVQEVEQRNKNFAVFLLSHFHTDHMKGLSAQWCGGPIICSEVTRALLIQRFGEQLGSLVVALPMWKRIGLLGARWTAGASAKEAPARDGNDGRSETLERGIRNSRCLDDPAVRVGGSSASENVDRVVAGDTWLGDVHNNHSFNGACGTRTSRVNGRGVVVVVQEEVWEGLVVRSGGGGGGHQGNREECSDFAQEGRENGVTMLPLRNSASDTSSDDEDEEPASPKGTVVYVTMLPAFHIPGSVMFFLETPMGNLLHTGDFKFNTQAREWLTPFFLRHRVDHVYIDDTWLHLGKEEKKSPTKAVNCDGYRHQAVCGACHHSPCFRAHRKEREGEENEGGSRQWESGWRPDDTTEDAALMEQQASCEMDTDRRREITALGLKRRHRDEGGRRRRRRRVRPTMRARPARTTSTLFPHSFSSQSYDHVPCLHERCHRCECEQSGPSERCKESLGISTHLLNEEQLFESFEALRKRMQLQKERFERACQQSALGSLRNGQDQMNNAANSLIVASESLSPSLPLPYRLRVYLHNQFGKEVLVQRLAMALGTRVMLDDQRYARLVTVSNAMEKEEQQDQEASLEDRGTTEDHPLSLDITVRTAERPFNDLLAKLWRRRGGERAVYGVNLDYFVPALPASALLSSSASQNYHSYSYSYSSFSSSPAFPRVVSRPDAGMSLMPSSSPQHGSNVICLDDEGDHSNVVEKSKGNVTWLPSGEPAERRQDRTAAAEGAPPRTLTTPPLPPPPLIEVVHRRSDIDPLLLQHLTAALQTPHYAVLMSGWARRGSRATHTIPSHHHTGGVGAEQGGTVPTDDAGVWHIPTTLHCTPQEIVDFVALLRPRSVTPFHYSTARDLVIFHRLGPYFRKPYENEPMKLYGACQDAVSHLHWQFLPRLTACEGASRACFLTGMVLTNEEAGEKQERHRSLGYALRKRGRDPLPHPIRSQGEAHDYRRRGLQKTFGVVNSGTAEVESIPFDVDARTNQGDHSYVSSTVGVEQQAGSRSDEVRIVDDDAIDTDDDSDDIARLLWGSSAPILRCSVDSCSTETHDREGGTPAGSSAITIKSQVVLSCTPSSSRARSSSLDSSVIALSCDPIPLDVDGEQEKSVTGPADKLLSLTELRKRRRAHVISVDSNVSPCMCREREESTNESQEANPVNTFDFTLKSDRSPKVMRSPPSSVYSSTPPLASLSSFCSSAPPHSPPTPPISSEMYDDSHSISNTALAYQHASNAMKSP